MISLSLHSKWNSIVILSGFVIPSVVEGSQMSRVEQEIKWYFLISRRAKSEISRLRSKWHTKTKSEISRRAWNDSNNVTLSETQWSRKISDFFCLVNQKVSFFLLSKHNLRSLDYARDDIKSIKKITRPLFQAHSTKENPLWKGRVCFAFM